ncbi:MAG: acyl-CoA dehydrogenase family protein [Hyphomonadaceae bacterium]
MSRLQTNYTRLPVQQADLVAAADRLAPILAARAQETERQRMLPKATMDDLFANGLLRYFIPARMGGHESEWGTQIHIGRALARACGSTAWIGCVVGSHALYISRMDPRAQDDVWGDTPDVLVATGSVMRNVTVDKEADGYRLSGRWSFCSGIDHASWALLRASPTGDQRQSYFLIPRSEITIEDDWYVSGMSGTGSKTAVVKDALIPFYRVLSMSEMMSPNPPGARANPHYLCTSSFRPFSGSNLLGPILGGAEAVYNAFRDMAEEGAGGLDKEDPQTLLQLIEAAAEIGAADRVTESLIQRQIAFGKAGQPIPKPERIAIVRDRTYVARLCLNAATRLMHHVDASAVLTDAPIQRYYRDLQGMMQQIGVNWDRNMLSAARAMFDLKTDIPDLNAD